MHNKGGQACVLGQRESTVHKCKLSPPLLFLRVRCASLPLAANFQLRKRERSLNFGLDLALTSSFSVALLFRSTKTSLTVAAAAQQRCSHNRRRLIK
ncbi:hypothetical protein SADUNF_Sadunf03G0040000 [Salix dunnii]|uniref:Uncharacterized protein n=1 Tax=Salix dunnii TaxID=1413687 RepID=A0A835N466_9ROSI|nr:hypothetical protein SADUNF_Sadunf03G0040000 [Salix dunnii]